MAKYEKNLTGNFNTFLQMVNEEILKGSISASFEDGSDIQMGNIRCVVNVYERYSWIGSNRVSLTVTLFGEMNNFTLSAITAGGSQAMFFKINTFGENAFLDCLVKIVDKYEKMYNLVNNEEPKSKYVK